MTYDRDGRRLYAAFRHDDGRVWVTVFYEGDRDVFADEDGATWRRITHLFWEFPSLATANYTKHLIEETQR